MNILYTNIGKNNLIIANETGAPIYNLSPRALIKSTPKNDINN